MTAFVLRALPKFGPLRYFEFQTPTADTEQLFAESLKATIADYEHRVADARLDPLDINLDTGRPTHPGDYSYCDRTYAKLLHRLEQTHFAAMTPELRAKLLVFYSDSEKDSTRRKPKRWRRVTRDLEKLTTTPNGLGS